MESLAGAVSFEEVCARLWAPYDQEPLPSWLQAALGEARVRAFGLLEGLGNALSAEDGMDALRAAMRLDAEQWLLRGDARAALGDTVGAREAWEKVVDVGPPEDLSVRAARERPAPLRLR